jgi:hypothetical protein
MFGFRGLDRFHMDPDPLNDVASQSKSALILVGIVAVDRFAKIEVSFT